MTDIFGVPAIRRVDQADVEQAAGLLAEAFLYGDVASWLVAGVDIRSRVCLTYFTLLIDHAIAHGQVEVVDDFHAVAVWYRLGKQLLPPIENYPTKLAMIVGEFLHRFQTVDTVRHAHRPSEVSYDYLAFLAVHPDWQNQRLGTALLRRHQAALDAAGIPAYAEATNSRSRSLFAQHGYLPRPAYRIAANGPELYPMWRRPARIACAPYPVAGRLE